jgi:glyoxylase-like metal-dependent hydrolase (beta-lactamase superfamily II)
MGAARLAEELGELYAARQADGSRPKLTWEEPDCWLSDGTLLDLPGRTLRTIHTPGHTAGHVVFHDEAGATLFAGDHVLPHITPSIGFQPADSLLALEHYLGSLRLMLTLPDARLLPAHGPVRASTHARVNELLEHHEVRLAQTREAASQGQVTAWEVAQVLPWTRRQRKLADLDLMNQMLAVGETAAHLEVLILRGQLVKERSPGGVDLYSLAAPPAPQTPGPEVPVG